LLLEAGGSASKLLNRRLWGLALENAAAIEPRPWYVRAIRAGGVGMIAAGVAGLALERAAETGEQRPGESAPATGE
jgi:hypothetical protein